MKSLLYTICVGLPPLIAFQPMLASVFGNAGSIFSKLISHAPTALYCCISLGQRYPFAGGGGDHCLGTPDLLEQRKNGLRKSYQIPVLYTHRRVESGGPRSLEAAGTGERLVDGLIDRQASLVGVVVRPEVFPLVTDGQGPRARRLTDEIEHVVGVC